MKIVPLERTARENAEKQAAVGRAFREIAQLVQGQATFNESSKRAIACLEKQVKIHRDNFHEVVRILQAHEQDIVNTGSITQGLSRNVVELSKDNEKNRMWMGNDERKPSSNTSPPATRNGPTSPGRSDQGDDEPAATAATPANRHRKRTNRDGG